MTNYTTFPTGAHRDDDDSVLIDYAMNIGRAYRNQVMELINLCRHFSHLAPQFAHQDDDLRRVLRICDLALRSAADSGKEVTDEANQRFKEATQVLSRYSERWHPGQQGQPSSVRVDERMEMTKWEDSLTALPAVGSSLQYFVEDWESTTTINFVLLRSPLASARDPDTVIVRQVLGASPRLSDILWNFSRFRDRARITLEQNPHFYSSLPTDESAYMPWCNFSPIKDFGKQWLQLQTIYVLVDRPGSVYFQTKQISRSFGNVWMINDFLIFKDHRGSLEGEQLVRLSVLPRNLWYCEQRIAFPDSGVYGRSDHRFMRPIVTTPLVTPAPASGRLFDDWTVLSHSASHSIHVHIYDAEQFSLLGSTVDTDLLPPPPPTSERPGYHVLYTSIESTNDDILFSIFNFYRLIDEKSWNLRLGWCKLSHVCRRWRNLIHESAFHLGMHILCTNGSPVLDTLAHLPSLPLIIDYQDETGTMGAKDELGMSQALQLRDRVRRVVLSIPPASLHKLLVLMDDSYPILEHLRLSSTAKGADADLILPRTFVAPNLCHLNLLGISLPNKIAATVLHCRPSHAHAHERPILEELSVCFSIPIPRPSAESELWNAPEPPVMLPVLKRLTFRGVGAYLESLVAQISAPRLEYLGITIFNQVAFTLPHLSHFINATEGLKLPIASVIFECGTVSVVADQRDRQQWADGPPNFSFRVICREFDWQVDCAAQICNALMPMLSGVEGLTLDFDGHRIPTEWQDGAVDGATWRELLEPFVGARKLRICHALVWELSLVLESEDAGLNPTLLPCLQELVPQLEEEHANHVFSSFIDAREIAGRPVRVSSPPVPPARPVWSEQRNPLEVDLASHPRSSLGSWFRAAVIDPIRSRLV
ncbi:hypothetical protein EDB84DRAFT_1577669 [Lactarius hengduanensis]|nr:hypothetical protein EDB84DRAFT_1577669 [Lactarius hengduanensis]